MLHMIEHQITHYYQPTNKSCSQASLAMVFSFFGKIMTPEEIMAQLSVNKDKQGNDLGTMNQELATWCIGQAFTAAIYTTDIQIIDSSWAALPKDKMLERMELAKPHRNVPSIGKHWSERYLQSYIDFIRAGGELHIEPYPTKTLLDRLIPASPLLVAVCYNVLHRRGRTKCIGLRENKLDDIEGSLATHSVVLYGYDGEGNYLIADPWEEPGRHVVEPERLLMAMAAAQIECDNLLFQLSKAGT